MTSTKLKEMVNTINQIKDVQSIRDKQPLEDMEWALKVVGLALVNFMRSATASGMAIADFLLVWNQLAGGLAGTFLMGEMIARNAHGYPLPLPYSAIKVRTEIGRH